MKKLEKQKLKPIEKRADSSINYSDIPELDDYFWEHAKIEYPENKKTITLRMDSDVLEWFRSSGKGYQTRINAILRSYFEANKKKNVPLNTLKPHN